jgi:hypothetical protein
MNGRAGFKYRSCVLCLGVVFLSLSRAACAFEIEHAEAHYRDHEYRVELSIVLDASPERIESILRDYASYPALDNSILEAKVLSRPSLDAVILFTKLRGCSGLFCRTVNRVERVEQEPLGLTATVIPEQSDVISGRTHTVLQTLNGRTRVHYQTSVVPKFWVPGLIGRPLMLRTLREASLDLFRHVEARAKR